MTAWKVPYLPQTFKSTRLSMKQFWKGWEKAAAAASLPPPQKKGFKFVKQEWQNKDKCSHDRQNELHNSVRSGTGKQQICCATSQEQKLWCAFILKVDVILAFHLVSELLSVKVWLCIRIIHILCCRCLFNKYILLFWKKTPKRNILTGWCTCPSPQCSPIPQKTTGPDQSWP